ncbi:MAG: hypothetical protein KAW47_10470, partial [Thermoplasmatales archaeon]|nr:hypothetical protein [Thermoplasmatales archaeon]
MADNLMLKTNEELKTISKQLRKENIEYKDYVEKQATRIIGVISDVAMGDFSVRAKHERNDDFGVLVIGLNIMIGKLEKQHTELEKKVEERTKDLVNSKRMIERQNIELKKLDRLKSDFINITSHELRTPLTSIKGYVQMSLNRVLGDISEEQQKGLEVVLRNANHLDDLVQDLLDVSQLQSGTMKFVPEQTDFRKM